MSLLDNVLKLIAQVNPLPLVLKLLPAKVAREVVLVLGVLAAILALPLNLVIPAGPVLVVLNVTLLVLTALGIRGAVIPVA